MAKYCSDCTYLDPKKPQKKKGKEIKGSYKCTKTGKFKTGNIPACDKFCTAYARKNYDRDKLYEEGKDLTENAPTNSNPGALLVLLIVLIILAFLANYKG